MRKTKSVKLDEQQEVFEYKCRRCSTVFDGCESSAQSASIHLVNACHLTFLKHSAVPPPKVSFHKCFPVMREGEGIGDLIGYRIEDCE